MKTKIFKYMFIALMGCMALASCGDEDTNSAGPQNEGEAVSFGTITASTAVTYLPEEDLSISFTVYRADGTTAVDVPVNVIENENDMFVIPSSIHFAAGETETELLITFPNMGLGETACFEVAIANGYQNLYATNMLRRTITRDYTWLTYSGSFTSEFDGLEDSPVKIQKADGYNIWRVVNPFTEYCEENGIEYDYNTLAQYINFVVNEDGSVTFSTYLNDLYEDKQIYAYWPLDLSASLAEEAAKAKVLDSYSIQLVPYYYVPDLGGGFGPYPVIISLDQTSGGKFGDFEEADTGSDSE